MNDAVSEPAARDDLRGLIEQALAPSYLLVRELGRGGMATVYLARDPALKRLVAVKLLKEKLSQDKRARVRFEREAQAAASISHPNVVSVYSVGELADGTPYFIMQHVEGPSFKERLAAEGSLGTEEGARLIGEVAAGLAAAHQKGIVHRDIKPSNVLYEVETGRALVADFGIAAAVRSPDAEDETASRVTSTGTVVGTPAYMSPEQLLGEPVTPKSDVYNLGLFAYDVLAGRGPFDIDSPRERMAAILRDTPRKLSELVDGIDPELDALLFSCLARDPEERPDAAEIARRLSPEAGTLLEWPPPGLESLQGALWTVVGAAGLGSGLLALSVLAPLARAAWLGEWPAYIAAAAGGLILTSALLRLVRLGWLAARRARAGFTLLTLAEVIADRRGDSGELIAGTRDYVGLDTRKRSRFRRLRLVRGAAALAAALWPAAGLVAGMALAVRLGMTWRFVAWAALGPSVGLVIVSAGSWLIELQAVWRARRSRRRVRGREMYLARLVGPWYESYDRARRAGRPAPRAPGRPLFVWAPTAVVAAFCLILGALVVSLPAVSAVLRAYWAWVVVPPFIGVVEKELALAEVMRPYRLAPDPVISAAEAGQALYSLYEVGRHRPFASVERPPERRYQEPWLPRETLVAAKAAFGYGSPFHSPGLVAQAATGLTAEQKAVLESLRAHPANAEYAIVARAGEADLLAARFHLPFPEDMHPGALPSFLRLAEQKDAAYAHIAVAALAVADGSTRDAELAARQIISHGLLLIDEASDFLEMWVGASIVGLGRETLREVYLATGRAGEALALYAAVDSVLARQGRRSFLDPSFADDALKDVESSRRYFNSVMSDTTATRGFRVEAFRVLQYSSCATLRGMLFGPSDEEQRAFTEARESLVRRPSDAALFDLLEGAATRSPSAPEGWFLRLTYRVVGILGGKRTQGCLNLVALF